MPPPMIRLSHFCSRFLMTPILSATLAPPKIATKGRWGFSKAWPIMDSSLPIRKPAKMCIRDSLKGTHDLLLSPAGNEGHLRFRITAPADLVRLPHPYHVPVHGPMDGVRR